MLDDAQIILEYLPRSFKNRSEQEYIEFLWQAFTTNYESGKYQFAMLAYHMLYMSFVYFAVWRLKLSRPQDFAKAVIFQQREKELLNASSPFTFSELQERSIFKFLRLIAGCEHHHIGQFAKFVDERNEIAHSNGNIFFSDQTTADKKINEVVEQVAAIQTHMQPIIHECFEHFLLDSYDKEKRQYEDLSDQIRETLIHANYFSQKDIEACLTFDIERLKSNEQFHAVKLVNEAYRAEYSELPV